MQLERRHVLRHLEEVRQKVLAHPVIGPVVQLRNVLVPGHVRGKTARSVPLNVIDHSEQSVHDIGRTQRVWKEEADRLGPRSF